MLGVCQFRTTSSQRVDYASEIFVSHSWPINVSVWRLLDVFFIVNEVLHKTNISQRCFFVYEKHSYVGFTCLLNQLAYLIHSKNFEGKMIKKAGGRERVRNNSD